MERYSVASSNVSSVGYDENTQTLEVEYLTGAIYQYYNVPQNIYEGMMDSPSKGRFLNLYIKDYYPYSRVG